MNKPVDDTMSADQRAKLIGLGKSSLSKSYYPELKERLEELQKFRTLLDQINDAIYVIDVDTGLITDVSGAGYSLIDCQAESLLGKEFKNLLPQHISKHLDSLFQSNKEILCIETELCCPLSSDPHPVPVEMTIRVARHQKGAQAVVVARDIARRKQAETELRISHEELELRVKERTRQLDRANRAKSEFLSIVSHELRTPLTSVLGFAKIIHKKLSETIFPAVGASDKKTRRDMDQVNENISIIVSEGQRLTQLINDVLDLAKLEANTTSFKMELIDPAGFIHQSTKALKSLFEEAGLTLKVEIEPDLPSIMGDKDRLVQVMVNLLSNAIKFTDHGTVHCRARAMARHVRISVQDPGTGIPRTLHEVIFDKFTQAGESLKDRPKGTGLGLPICRNIINGHNGYIWVESAPGHGSEFIFTIPQAQLNNLHAGNLLNDKIRP